MIDKFFKQLLKCAAIFGLLLCLVQPALAWSTYTHAAVSAESFAEFQSLLPQAVFSSSLPDVTTNFISPASKDEFYKIFHGENFYKAALKTLAKLDKNLDKTMICNIYGYLSHAAADKTAHDQSGYANSKKTFGVKHELDHYVAYLFMDMLCYYDYFYGYNSRFGKFVPDVDSSLVKAALDEYNTLSGESVRFDKASFAKKEAMFKAGITVQKAIFDILIEGNPELFEQARSFYGDYYFGVNGFGGFYDAVAAVRENVARGGGVKLSESAVKSFVNKQISDITYIGMQFASAIAKDTEFLRTSKLTSGKLEGLVSKFFESKSQSTQSMGKFLSALLLKKGLTYEEIIDYTDGVAAGASKESEKSKKYRSAYKKLKEPRWYSFIPGADSKEKREYIDAFVDYQKERTESEITGAGLSPAQAEAFRSAQHKRLSAYREAYLASKLNPLKYVAKKAASDAAFENAGAARSLAAAQKSAGAAAGLHAKIRAMIDKNIKYRKDAAGRKFGEKLMNPLKYLYEKEFASAAALNNAELEKLAAVFKPAAVTSASTAVPAESVSAAVEDPSAIISGASAENRAGSGSNSSLLLMRKAYEDYVEYLSANDPGDERVRKELDRRLKKYIFYKNAHEKSLSGPGMK